MKKPPTPPLSKPADKGAQKPAQPLPAASYPITPQQEGVLVKAMKAAMFDGLLTASEYDILEELCSALENDTYLLLTTERPDSWPPLP